MQHFRPTNGAGMAPFYVRHRYRFAFKSTATLSANRLVLSAGGQTAGEAKYFASIVAHG
jgi:hypothetical protein